MRPYRFANQPGFRFTLSYTGQRGNLLTGDAFGAVVDGKLHLILYVGHPEYYFDRRKEEAEQLIATLQL